MANNIYNSNYMHSLQWTNSTGVDVLSGEIVVMGASADATLGVALVDIAAGASGSVGIDCGVQAAKVSAAVFADGESLVWDSSAAAFDDNAATPGAGDVAGSCRADKSGASSELTCEVWLTGIPGVLT